MPFLDKTGLAHLWTQIIARLNGKAEVSDLNDLKASMTEQISTAINDITYPVTSVNGKTGEVSISIPTSLKNPNAITFTGAAAGTYDGSSATTINIPTVAGEKGEDGHSPVRGTDYWTETDKAEIKSYVDEAILGGAW